MKSINQRRTSSLMNNISLSIHEKKEDYEVEIQEIHEIHEIQEKEEQKQQKEEKEENENEYEYEYDDLEEYLQINDKGKEEGKKDSLRNPSIRRAYSPVIRQLDFNFGNEEEIIENHHHNHHHHHHHHEEKSVHWKMDDESTSNFFNISNQSKYYSNNNERIPIQNEYEKCTSETNNKEKEKKKDYNMKSLFIQKLILTTLTRK